MNNESILYNYRRVLTWYIVIWMNGLDMLFLRGIEVNYGSSIYGCFLCYENVLIKC